MLLKHKSINKAKEEWFRNGNGISPDVLVLLLFHQMMWISPANMEMCFDDVWNSSYLGWCGDGWNHPVALFLCCHFVKTKPLWFWNFRRAHVRCLHSWFMTYLYWFSSSNIHKPDLTVIIQLTFGINLALWRSKPLYPVWKRYKHVVCVGRKKTQFGMQWQCILQKAVLEITELNDYISIQWLYFKYPLVN